MRIDLMVYCALFVGFQLYLVGKRKFFFHLNVCILHESRQTKPQMYRVSRFLTKMPLTVEANFLLTRMVALRRASGCMRQAS